MRRTQFLAYCAAAVMVGGTMLGAAGALAGSDEAGTVRPTPLAVEAPGAPTTPDAGVATVATRNRSEDTRGAPLPEVVAPAPAKDRAELEDQDHDGEHEDHDHEYEED